MSCGFPGACTLIRVNALHDSTADWEDRYYVSSHETNVCSKALWQSLCRNHWSVENKNHWRKDAVLFEDRMRSRNANLVSNLAILRQIPLLAYEFHGEMYENFKAWIEHHRANEHLLTSMILHFSGA
jgi:hypothetical protein